MDGRIDTAAITTPPRLALDADALLAYVSRHVPAVRRAGRRKVRSLIVSQFGHGQSNPTYKVTCADASGAPVPNLTFVLRKKPPGKILRSAHAVEREHAVQSALGALRRGGAGGDVPVPTMLALCEDPSVVGTPFYLMSFVDGHVFTKPGLDSLPSPAHRRAVYDAMADTLGALHRIDPGRIGLGSFGSGSIGQSVNPVKVNPVNPSTGRSGSGGASWSERQLERWARQYSLSLVGDADPEPAVTALVDWLRANRPVAEPGGRLVHGDFRLDNIVFESPVGPGPAGTGKDDGDEHKDKDEPAPGRGVLAVLDWELSTLGSPYGDVAYCCMPYHLPPASSSSGAPAAYPAFAGSIPPDGVPTEAEFVHRWCVASGLPNPRTRTERVAGDPKGAKKPVWPFYVALSLFRGAAILAGVRARASAGNASAANAAEAGSLVETLAARALVVAGVPVGSIPRPVRSGGGGGGGDANGNDVGLTFVRGMEPSERAASLLVKLRAFMSDHVYPAEPILEAHAASDRRWEVHPKVEELKALAKAAGLWNLWLPRDSGRLLKIAPRAGEDQSEVGAWMRGPGLTNLEYAHLAGCMGASVWASEFFNCSAPDTGNMEVLLRYGTQAQQERWLRPLLLGTIRSCFAMTEPAVASSDATNVTSSIVRRGDSYVVNGRKWWTSGACDPRCELAIFMGKTTPDNTPGVPKHRQQTMVLVPMRTKGVTVVRPLPVFGYDDAPHGHAETTFEDVVVSAKDAELLGEGRGFEIAQGRLGPGRLHHCMRLIGMGERALTLAARRAESRVAFGQVSRRKARLLSSQTGPIVPSRLSPACGLFFTSQPPPLSPVRSQPLSRNASVLQTLGRARVTLDGARLATLDAARRLDAEGNKAAKGAIAACKVAAPAAAIAVIDAAIQIHGALGVCDDTPLARMFAGARTLRLADGPDEVHLETIAKLEVRRSRM